MVTDKNGKELKEGDEIVIRGKIVAVIASENGGQGILDVEWSADAFPLSYFFPHKVEKAE